MQDIRRRLSCLIARLGLGRWRPAGRRLAALGDGLRALREGDYSLSLVPGAEDQAGDLIRSYNALAESLRRERQHRHQHELLLDTVMQTTPQALLLSDADQRVIYSNAAARQRFGQGRKLEGYRYPDLFAQEPEALREAALGGDGLVSVNRDGETETWQVAHSAFSIHAQPHRLHQFLRLTRDINRQELATYRRLLRVISHELNNSLAPISSLAHSSRRLLAQIPAEAGDPRLDSALATIEERAQRLKQFLDSYAQFARLPAPQPQVVPWVPFVEQVRRAVGFQLTQPTPDRPGWFDRAQLEQALINLLKNAHESGSAAEAVELDVAEDGGGTRLRVLDRGSGLNQAVLTQALLPFYSTKPGGSGLGLALCREIVEAHGGRLALGNREGGGAEVRLWLPGRTD